MGRRKAIPESQSSNYIEPPALTIEEREDQLIGLAVNLVEKRLIEGTASSAETVHFLKLGSTKERQEREKMQEEIKLLRAKTEELQSAKSVQELYAKAIRKFGIYRGEDIDEEDEEYEQD